MKAKYIKILQAWVALNSVFPCLEALSEALLLCGNYETGVSFEMVTSTLRSSFFTQNLRGMTFLEILNKFFFCIMCSKANILPEVSQRRRNGRALLCLVARSLLGNNARAKQRLAASWEMRRRQDMKPLCLGTWKGRLLKDSHDLACKAFPGRESLHLCTL